MTLETWIAFCLVELVLCLTPGPAVLFVVSTALTRGSRAAFAGAGGILLGNTLYFGLSATGIAAILLASSYLFTAIKWIGAAYLVWLGLHMLLAKSRPASAAPAVPTEPAVHADSLWRGFAVQAANPKALAFFVALLPQFIDPAVPIVGQILILGLSSAVIELGVLGMYILVATGTRALAGRRVAGLIRRAAGGLLVAAGARLAFVRTS
jgi:homoserine/homoserine lactone efflux protein